MQGEIVFKELSYFRPCGFRSLFKLITCHPVSDDPIKVFPEFYNWL